MDTDAYLRGILQREAVGTGALSVMTTLGPTIRTWSNGRLLEMKVSGSYAKGTANHSGTDIDLFLSLSESTTETLKQMYDSLFNAMKSAGYSPKKQNVSINIRVNGWDVDLVPGKRQNAFNTDHSLYRRRADTWTKTNVDTHIITVLGAWRSDAIRLFKLWRNQRSLDFPSFYLELVIIEALRGQTLTLSGQVSAVLFYLRDRFENARFVDPANTANIISDDLTPAEKKKIASAATASLAQPWTDFVK